MAVERFTTKVGTISIVKNTSTVTGTGTLFGSRDREGATIHAFPLGTGSPPTSKVPILVGIVAAVEPRGVYSHTSLPLTNVYRGDSLVNVPYVLTDGPAIANSATQAAIFARFAGFLEDNAGLVFNTIDDPDYSLVPNNSLVVTPAQASPAVAAKLYQFRNGLLSQIFADSVPLAGGTMTGPLEYKAPVSIPSATTTLIGSATSNAVTITGSTSITGFGSAAAGVLRFVKFAASLVISHSSVGIILPGGLPIITQANDTAIFQAQGGSVWLCVDYKRQSGKPITAPDLADVVVQGSPSAANTMFYWDADVHPALFGISAAGRSWLNGNISAELYKELTADEAGANSSAAQAWFPTLGSFTVVAGRYRFRGQLRTTRTAGAVSHTTGIIFGGTATVTTIDYLGLARTGDTDVLAAIQGLWTSSATELVLKIATTATTEHTIITVEGWVVFGTGGTFIPQFKYSAAPGGAPTVNRGTSFHLTPYSASSKLS